MNANTQVLRELVLLYCFLVTRNPEEDSLEVTLKKFESYRKKPSVIRSVFPSGDTLESLNDVRTWR